MHPAILEELWEHSPAKGSSLLLLLAIARHANHDGTGAYPSLATLKRLTRLSHSQVCLLLKQLVEDGHLAITHGEGPGGTNTYAIMRVWDTSSRPKIGHAKTAHPKSARAIGHPKIGPKPEPKEREKISVVYSDVQKSDVLKSDRTSGVEVTEKAAHLVSTWVSPGFTQVLQGKDPTSPPATEATAVEVPSVPSPPRKYPFDATRFTLGAPCPDDPTHRYGDTGQSLRSLKDQTCRLCGLAAKRQAQG